MDATAMAVKLSGKFIGYSTINGNIGWCHM